MDTYTSRFKVYGCSGSVARWVHDESAPWLLALVLLARIALRVRDFGKKIKLALFTFDPFSLSSE